MVSVTLLCKASSTSLPAANRPALTYTWTRNGQPIDRDNPPGRHSVSNATGRLDISRDRRDDVTYGCTAQEERSILNSQTTRNLGVLWACDAGPCSCECTCDPTCGPPTGTNAPESTPPPAPGPTPPPAPEPAPPPVPEPPAATTPPTPTAPVCSLEPRDIVFVLDKSGSVGETHWPSVVNFVADVIAGIPVSQADGHVGIVRYSGPTEIYKDFDMTLFDKAALEAGVRALPYNSPPTELVLGLFPHIHTGYTYTNLGLDAARELLRDHARPGVPSTIVVVTDGITTTPIETLVSVLAAKTEGHEIIAVGIGGITLGDLAALATNGVMYKADSFETLQAIREQLTGSVCA